MHVHKTTYERNSSLGYHHVTWSQMGKQNIQAKKVYLSTQGEIGACEFLTLLVFN